MLLVAEAVLAVLERVQVRQKQVDAVAAQRRGKLERTETPLQLLGLRFRDIKEETGLLDSLVLAVAVVAALLAIMLRQILLVLAALVQSLQSLARHRRLH
jgi:hypothetical protein